MEVLEAAILWKTKTDAPIFDENIHQAMLALVERLAEDPTDQRLRSDLTRLVLPSVHGHTGLALMVAIVLNLTRRPVKLTGREAAHGTGMERLLQRKTFLRSAFTWLSHESPVLLGRIVMPQALLTEPADEVVSAVKQYLRDAPIADQDDVVALTRMLALGTSLVPHSTDPDSDVSLVWLVGAKAREFRVRSVSARLRRTSAHEQRGIAKTAAARLVCNG